MKLITEKQASFCREYIIDKNATAAAIRAGYSPKTATPQAAALLTKLNIKETIAGLLKEQEQRTGITADRVLKEYAKLSFSDIRHYYDEAGNLKNPAELSDDAAAALLV